MASPTQRNWKQSNSRPSFNSFPRRPYAYSNPSYSRGPPSSRFSNSTSYRHTNYHQDKYILPILHRQAYESHPLLSAQHNSRKLLRKRFIRETKRVKVPFRQRKGVHMKYDEEGQIINERLIENSLAPSEISLRTEKLFNDNSRLLSIRQQIYGPPIEYDYESDNENDEEELKQFQQRIYNNLSSRIEKALTFTSTDVSPPSGAIQDETNTSEADTHFKLPFRLFSTNPIAGLLFMKNATIKYESQLDTINRRPDNYYIRDDDEEEQIKKMAESAAITVEDVRKEKSIVWERCIKEHKIIKGFHRSSKHKTN